MRSGTRFSMLFLAVFILPVLPAAAISVVEDHQDIEGPFVTGPVVFFE